MASLHKCRTLQAAAGVVLLMLCVFIDGTHLSNDGGQKALPVYLTLGNIRNEVARYGALINFELDVQFCSPTCQRAIFTCIAWVSAHSGERVHPGGGRFQHVQRAAVSNLARRSATGMQCGRLADVHWTSVMRFGF